MAEPRPVTVTLVGLKVSPTASLSMILTRASPLTLWYVCVPEAACPIVASSLTASSSSATETVTGCGVLQFEGVKVNVF